MSDQEFIRETHRAINKMRVILGVHWLVFAAVTGVCFLILQYVSFNVGALLWVAALAGVKAVTKKDPRILKVLWVAWFFKPVYDPFKREPFALIIVEDE